MQFLIEEVGPGWTRVTFTFDDSSTSTQTIANVPADEQAAARFLTEYAVAYLAGKAVEKAQAATLKPGTVLSPVQVDGTMVMNGSLFVAPTDEHGSVFLGKL